MTGCNDAALLRSHVKPSLEKEKKKAGIPSAHWVNICRRCLQPEQFCRERALGTGGEGGRGEGGRKRAIDRFTERKRVGGGG